MDAKSMRRGWGEAEIVWFESGGVICRAADHAEAIGHRPQAIPVDGMFSRPHGAASRFQKLALVWYLMMFCTAESLVFMASP